MGLRFKIWLIVLGLVSIVVGAFLTAPLVPEDFELELQSQPGWEKKALSGSDLAQYGVKLDSRLLLSIEHYEREGISLIVSHLNSVRFEGLLNGTLKQEISGLKRRNLRILSDRQIEHEGAKGFRIRSVGDDQDGRQFLATFYFFTTDNRSISLRFTTAYNQKATAETEQVLGFLKVRAESGKEAHTWNDQRPVRRPAGFGKPHLALLFLLLGILLTGSGLVSAMFRR